MTRWIGLCLGALAAAPAAAGEAALTPRQRAELRVAADRLRRMAGPLTARKAERFDIEQFGAKDLAHVAGAVDDLDEPENVRRALARLCRTALHRRGPLGRVERAPEVCFLIAGGDLEDWLKAYRLLRREPVGPTLDRAVVALQRDPRPEIRLIAVRLAKTLVAFGRGSKDLVECVLRGTADPHPNVAALCIVEAADTRDKRAVDRMLAGLDDARRLRARTSPLLRCSPRRSVRDLALQSLGTLEWFERMSEWQLRRPPPGQPVELPPKPIERTADEIRAWWRKGRAAFGFGVPAPAWKPIFDEALLLTLGRPVVVRLGEGTPLRIVVRSYRESLRDGEPVTYIDAELTDVRYPKDERHVGYPGNSGVGIYDRTVTAGGLNWGVDTPDGNTLEGMLWWRGVFLPTHDPKRVRLRLNVHLKHDD